MHIVDLMQGFLNYVFHRVCSALMDFHTSLVVLLDFTLMTSANSVLSKMKLGVAL